MAAEFIYQLLIDIPARTWIFVTTIILIVWSSYYIYITKPAQKRKRKNDEEA